jgi:hypothetical protein
LAFELKSEPQISAEQPQEEDSAALDSELWRLAAQE